MAQATRLDFRKMRVLMVDDNPHALDLLTQIFLGFRVEQVKACASAEEARRIVAQSIFDVVIVDAEMPNEHGLAFTREIRRQFDQPNFMVPIILVSGNTPVAKVIEARDAGANAVIKKPVAPSVLLTRIEKLARSDRDFVSSAGYVGPDRRFKNLPLSADLPERRAEAMALMASPERAMSQDDVNALFG